MGYGFALLAKGRGVRFSSPAEGDSVFTLVDEKSGVAAAGRLPRLEHGEIVRRNIRRSIESMANDWFTWPAARRQTVKKLKKDFDPVLYEFLRIEKELERFHIPLGRFGGEVFLFLRKKRGVSIESIAELAGIMTAAGYIGFSTKRIRHVSPAKARNKVLEFHNEGKKKKSRLVFLGRAEASKGTELPSRGSAGRIMRADTKSDRSEKDDVEVIGAGNGIEMSSTVRLADPLDALIAGSALMPRVK